MAGSRMTERDAAATGLLHSTGLFRALEGDASVFREALHDRGPLLPALMAGSALPGVLPPRDRALRLRVCAHARRRMGVSSSG